MERDDMMNTMKFDVKADRPMQPREILLTVHHALEEKGYNPINQMVGYVLSGDPSYITSYQGARNLIRKLERDEILEELVTFYVNHRTEGE